MAPARATVAMRPERFMGWIYLRSSTLHVSNVTELSPVSAEWPKKSALRCFGGARRGSFRVVQRTGRGRLSRALLQRTTTVLVTTAGLGIALALSQHTREPVSTRLPSPAVERRAAPFEEAMSRSTDVDAMLGALNTLRTAKGLRPLILDPQLCAIARTHGTDMATRGYFDHTSPEGISPFGRLDRAHYRYGYAAENLALDRDVASAQRAFVASPAHRTNMLETHFIHVGIAAVASSSGQIYVVDFSD